MSNSNLPLSASPVGTMPPSDDEPILSGEDDTSSVDKTIPFSYMSSILTAKPCTCVFWDVVDFPFPSFKPDLIFRRIKFFLEGEGLLIGELSIIAYVDDKENMRKYDAYEEAGFTIRPHEGREFFLVDIVLWAMENPATYFEPFNLMVISKNKETYFLNALEALNDRYYNVLVALTESLSSSRKLHTVCFVFLIFGYDSPVKKGTFHYERKRKDGSVWFSDGLASVPGRFRGFVNVFWDVAFLIDLHSIDYALNEMGYGPSIMLTWRYTSDPKGTRWQENHQDFYLYPHDETFVYEDAKVTTMLLDVLFWAMNNHDVPQYLMIISKQCSKWDSVIQALHRCGFNVIFQFFAEVACGVTFEDFENFCNRQPEGKTLRKSVVKPHGRKFKKKSQIQLARKNLHVLWLVEDCPSNPELLSHVVNHALMLKGYGKVLSITAYAYESKFSEDLANAYCKAGVRVLLIGKEDKWERVTMASVNMIDKAPLYEGKANYLVISKPFKSDAIWIGVIDYLKRTGCRVFCEQPDYMFTFGSWLWSAKDLY